jgi:hypothetical protein
VNVADACAVPSLTVTVMVYEPAARVPLIVPVEELIVTPDGNPVAEYWSVLPSGSDAVMACVNEPAETVRFPGFVITGGRFVLVTVHVKVRELDPPVAVAVTTTVCVPLLVYVSVPVMLPLLELSVSEGGNPVALYVIVSPSASVADNCNVTEAPSALVRFPGFVRTGAAFAVTVKVNVVDA